VLAVLGAGDHRQPGVHGTALRGVIGDGVPPARRLRSSRTGTGGRSSGAARGRVGVQRPADDQPVSGDGLDAQQVAVGQGAAGFAGFERVVVAGTDDQVPGTGLGSVGDADRGPGLDDAEADEVVADAAGQFPAQRMVGGH